MEESMEPKETDHEGNPMTYWGGKDLTGSERKVNWPEPKEEQISEYEKHLERTIKFWESKYRKLEEELDVERKCFREQTKVLYEIKDENGKLEEDLINTRAGWKKEHDLRQVYQLRIEKLEEENIELSDYLKSAGETVENMAKAVEELQSENSLLLGKVKELEELNQTLNLRSQF